MSLGQLMIFVNSLTEAKAFYSKYIGLQVVQDMTEEAEMLIMKNEGAYLTIHGGFQPTQIKKEECRCTPIFKVKDITEVRQKMLDDGLDLHGDIVETPVHKYQSLRDLDGNWIEVAQFKN